MNDGKSSENDLDLVGGFYDAGNNIKFSFTIAYTVSLLGWTVIEYHEKYEDIGEIDHVEDIIKWGSLYLLKLFVPPNNSSARIYSQVGGNNSNAENDLTCWQRPEDMNYPRLVSVCDISTASDLTGEMVAAMSAASLVLKEDKDISEKSAEELFILRKLYSDYLQLLRTPSRRCSDSVFSSESLKQFSQSQVNYILGDNPLKMCYVVGYGNT